MASRVKPRPPYDPNFGVKPKPPARSLQRKKRINPVSKKRAKENREHDQIRNNFMRTNKLCDCGCQQPSSEAHHICGGSFGRAASLYDTDVWLAAASECHAESFGDKAMCSVAHQVAMKWAAILRKVNKYRGRAETAITIREVLEHLDMGEA